MRQLRFAGHLGVRAPDAPLLRHLAGSTDPVRQIELLASKGMAGLFDNYLLLRDVETQARIGAVARRVGLAVGSFVHAPLRWNAPDWTTGAALETIEATRAAAERSGARTVVCVTGRQEGQDTKNQRRAFAQTLRRAADALEGSGIALCVEATHPSFAPGLLIERVEEALEVIGWADHPQIRIDLDLGHIALHGEDPVAAIRAASGQIGMVQVADVPGRVEPGAGHLDWAAIFAALHSAGYEGLLELELEPSGPGEAGERAMLARLVSLARDQNEKPMSTP